MSIQVLGGGCCAPAPPFRIFRLLRFPWVMLFYWFNILWMIQEGWVLILNKLAIYLSPSLCNYFKNQFPVTVLSSQYLVNRFSWLCNWWLKVQIGRMKFMLSCPFTLDSLTVDVLLFCHNLILYWFADFIWNTLHCESWDGSTYLFEDGCGKELHLKIVCSL